MTFEKYQAVCKYLDYAIDKVKWAIVTLDEEQFDYFKAKFEIDLKNLYEIHGENIKNGTVHY